MAGVRAAPSEPHAACDRHRQVSVVRAIDLLRPSVAHVVPALFRVHRTARLQVSVPDNQLTSLSSAVRPRCENDADRTGARGRRSGPWTLTSGRSPGCDVRTCGRATARQVFPRLTDGQPPRARTYSAHPAARPRPLHGEKQRSISEGAQATCWPCWTAARDDSRRGLRWGWLQTPSRSAAQARRLRRALGLLQSR